MNKIVEISENIKKYVTEIEPRNQLPIEITAKFIDDLWFDSLSFMGLIVYIETEYAIELNPEDLVMEKIETIEQLAHLVLNSLEEKEKVK